MAILFWPTWVATSGSVTPTLESAAGTSLIVPVIVPPGSPAFNASRRGSLARGIFQFGCAAEGGGVAAGAGAAACARAAVLSESRSQTGRNTNKLVGSVSLLFAPWSFFDCWNRARPYAFQIAFLLKAAGKKR